MNLKELLKQYNNDIEYTVEYSNCDCKNLRHYRFSDCMGDIRGCETGCCHKTCDCCDDCKDTMCDCTGKCHDCCSNLCNWCGGTTCGIITSGIFGLGVFCGVGYSIWWFCCC